MHLLLFPEAYLGGYPRTCTFGTSVGARDERGREQWLAYWKQGVDLGDSPRGRGEQWIRADGEDKIKRGDGTREELERIARETGVFLVVGVVEKAGGSLYCGVVYVDPQLGCVGKRRKVMPTGMERVVWAQGGTETLRAVVATLGGDGDGDKGVRVVLAAAVCWENYMPLLRWSLYAQDVNLWLAPTADARETWLPLMRTVAVEGRCVVVSANQCVRRRDLPGWITGSEEEEEEKKKKKKVTTGGEVGNGWKRRKSVRMETEEGHELVLPSFSKTEKSEKGDGGKDGAAVNGTSPLRFSEIPADDGVTNRKESNDNAPGNHVLALPSTGQPAPDTSSAVDDTDDEFVSTGGSCIIGPSGEVLAGPLWEVDEGGLLIAKVDLEDCERGRLDLDVAGSYGRLDSFELKVKGLELSPPP